MDEAIVLHLRPYRENSLLVDLFAREGGRQRLLARGARRKPGGSKPALVSFHRIFFSAGGGDGLRLLTQWEEAPESPELSGSAIFCGFYIAELLLKLLSQADPTPHLYDETLSTLRALSGSSDFDTILRRFECVILEEAGYGLSLQEDTQGRPIEPRARYLYHPENGAERVSYTSEGVPGSVLISLATGDFPLDQDRVLAKRMMRQVLDWHLEGRSIRSRELFKTFLGRK